MQIHHVYDHEGKWMVFATESSLGFCFEKDSAEGKEIAVHILAHPDALIPEPLPPPPTDAQLEAAAESQRQAYFRAYDDAVWIIEQQCKRGSITQAECDARLAPWYAFARGLELVNDEPGWFRAPEWPEKPEA